MARKRTQAQIEAEAAYAAAHPLVQINLKFKTTADLQMWDALRAKYPGVADSGIARLAVKEFASRALKRKT
jgi:hypothetical protein